MNSLKVVTASVLLAATPLLAHADDMSYRYFQVGYMSVDLDTDGFVAAGDESGDGFATRGSFGFANNFFVFTEYSKNAFDFNFDTGAGVVPVDVDLDQITAGLGGHFPLSDNLDVVGRAGWSKVNIDVKVNGVSDDGDDTGYLVGAGLRGRLGENFELEGGVIYQDFDDLGNDTGAEILARWNFNERWALAAEFQDIGEVSSYIIGVRVSF